MPQPRQARADAVRNREKILAAAREQITLNGPDVGMDEVAAAAGLAVGTLYRNFATKADLVEAVISDHVDDLAEHAHDALGRAGAGARAVDELVAFLEYVVEASAADQAIKTAARTLGADPSESPREQDVLADIAQLLALAQGEGDIRPDVSVEDLYLLFTTAPTDRPAAERARWLALVARALTTAPSPVAQPPAR
jgi:AcrR family transcriptional regulator